MWIAYFSGATWMILPASGCAQDRAGIKSCIELLEIFSLMTILGFIQRKQGYSKMERALAIKEAI